jgi:MFS family permease
VTGLDAGSARRRYLTLVALRWAAPGFLIPIFVLLPLSRGLSLTEIGIVFSAQGFVVLALELPTGGLSDALGRRPVQILATCVGLVSLVVFYAADAFAPFVVAMLLQGVYRALDSGPLEAWYVDTTLAADPDAKIERGLGAASSVLSAAIATAALLSGALIAVDPFEGIPTLDLPVLVAIGLYAVNLVAVVLLMTEERRARGARAIAQSIVSVPSVIVDGLRLLRRSRVLLGIVMVELFWGFCMVCFESLFPVRLTEVVGGTETAGALMGPVSSAAWFASAAGAALIVPISARIGVAVSAAALRVIQGITILAMGLIAGPIGLVTAYLACYIAHGASNPMHMTLLHRQVEGPNRTTVISMNSMVSQPAGSIGTIILAAVADGSSVTTALLIGAVVCAVAAPLYLPAWRQERSDRGARADLGGDSGHPVLEGWVAAIPGHDPEPGEGQGPTGPA